MKLRIDQNGFIWEAVQDGEPIGGSDGYTIVDYPDALDFLTAGLPKYRYVNGVVSRATAEDYKLDMHLWHRILERARAEVRDAVMTKSVADLKTLYDNSPKHIQDLIFEEIEVKWGQTVSTHRLNLAMESITRMLVEVMFIREVEGRELTEQERTGLHAMLSMVHMHNYFMDLPLRDNAWYQTYIQDVLEGADLARYGCLPERIFVTGR